MVAVVNNLTTLTVDRNFIKEAAENVLIREKSRKKNFSLVLVGPDRMKSLNWKYRRKNRTTDVLTFPDLDIVICPQVVEDNAKKSGSAFKHELARVVIHGVLHFLGYDHEKSEDEAREMGRKEERYLKNIDSFLMTNDK